MSSPLKMPIHYHLCRVYGTFSCRCDSGGPLCDFWTFGISQISPCCVISLCDCSWISQRNTITILTPKKYLSSHLSRYFDRLSLSLEGDSSSLSTGSCLISRSVSRRSLSRSLDRLRLRSNPERNYPIFI